MNCGISREKKRKGGGKPQDQVEFLTHLGLTINQAKIYLALVQSRPCTANQISKSANLASEVVYRTMPKLQKMGLVERTVAVPTVFLAIPIKLAISILLAQRKQENADVEAK